MRPGQIVRRRGMKLTAAVVQVYNKDSLKFGWAKLDRKLGEYRLWPVAELEIVSNTGSNHGQVKNRGAGRGLDTGGASASGARTQAHADLCHV